jgi:hypothetical protein
MRKFVAAENQDVATKTGRPLGRRKTKKILYPQEDRRRKCLRA